jgi:hypothetical protein
VRRISGWIFEDNVTKVVEYVASLVSYSWGEFDDGALEAGILKTDAGESQEIVTTGREHDDRWRDGRCARRTVRDAAGSSLTDMAGYLGIGLEPRVAPGIVASLCRKGLCLKQDRREGD